MPRIIAHATLVLFAVVASGCAGGAAPSDRPKTTPVAGVVTHKSAPVEGAIVKFERTDRAYGATGVTNQKGEFQLATFAAADGAVPGEYYVTIVKPPPADPNANKSVDQDDPSYNPDNEAPEGVAEAPPPKLATTLPAKYADPVTSGFKETIGETPRTDLKYDLVD
jgi:hypothetical protein